MTAGGGPGVSGGPGDSGAPGGIRSVGPVVVLGDLMVDVVASLRGPLVPASDSPASIAYRGGGSAANTACWLASQGVETVFVGAVGDDAAGRSAVEELRALGCGLRSRSIPRDRRGR